MAGYKILIIEDEPVHLNVMKAKLEYEGYEILVATDGETGLNMIKSQKPDLVLLDIILPKMNGFEVLDNLKNYGPKPPIIVVSNSGQPVEVDKALKFGAIDYLVKAEFNAGDVLEKVDKVLGHPQKSPEIRPAKSSAPKNINTEYSNNKNNPALGQTKILIIEDDKFLRDLISQKLKKEGFNALEAIDGEEGLKIARERTPDIILLDLILPGLDGFEILRVLKSDKNTSQIPVIVLSNLGQKEDMDKALSGGAEDFMVKAHFTPGEIVTKIKSVLKKKYF